MDETRQGLDILLDLYPQAKDCVGKKKLFKMRLSEKTASATIRQNKADLWVVHDFGGDDEDLNAIDAWMRFHGWDKSRFGAAVLAIAQEYGIRDELSADKNFARVVERQAKDNELEGQWYYEIREFTDRELKILGPGVTRDTCEQLHWHALEWLGKVKDRRIKEFHSNETFPIFLRECFVEQPEQGKPDRFYKVYRPYEPDKRWRFMYFPEGVKPQNYINGLYELRKEHKRLNEQKNKREGNDEVGGTTTVDNIEKTMDRGVQRYYRVVLCSGERDALCVKARGDCPVWLNSETARLDQQDYRQIIRLAGTLTNIPDLDSTGIARGCAQALKYMEMKTCWLPDTLKDMKDNRGRPSKDFRDWCQYFPTKEDYYDLMDRAVEAKFWTTTVNKNGDRRHRIDPTCLHNFLRLQGFAVLRDEDNGDEPQLVRVKDNVVYRKIPRDVRDFVRLWSQSARDPDVPTETLGQDTQLRMEHGVRNLILTDVAFTSAYLSALPSVSPDFTSYTARTQDFYFRNGLVHCHGDGYEFHAWRDHQLETCVWNDQIIPHDFRTLPPMFEVEWEPGETMSDGLTPRFRLTIHDSLSSHLLGYLINTSRLYWRQEMEQTCGDSADAQHAYIELHPFEIAADALTDRQREDQAQSLLNKLFTIGYLLHAYKNPSRAWAAFLMDNRIAEGSEANGRSGKSLFMKSLEQLTHFSVLSENGKKIDPKNDDHLFSDVTRQTRLVAVDDIRQYTDMTDFYTYITGDMRVNPKGLSQFTIPFSDSPKFLFSTNYAPADFDASSDARMLYVTCSDWYHQRTPENPFGYADSRSPADDFGKNLYDSFYTEAEWNADLNLLMQCERLYLSVCHRPWKLQPPMQNIILRKLKTEMGQQFEEWATVFFAQDSPNVNRALVRKNVYEQYLKDCPGVKDSMKKFSQRLTAFSKWATWIYALNPKDVLNTQGRFIQRSRDPQTGEVVQFEMIMLRTKDEEQRLREADKTWQDVHPGLFQPNVEC